MVFTEYVLDLTWVDGDWRLTAPDWGDWRSVATIVERPDPAAYASYDHLDAPPAAATGAGDGGWPLSATAATAASAASPAGSGAVSDVASGGA